MSEEMWKKNLEAMDRQYPAFVKLIQEKTDVEDDTEVLVEKSMDGEIIFRIQKDDKLLYLGGRREAKHPVQVWKERIGKIHKYAAVFLFGAGSGAYIKAIMEDFPDEANLIVYEPSLNIFMKLLREVDLSEEIKKQLKTLGKYVDEMVINRRTWHKML